MSPELEAIVQRNMNPVPSTELSPYFAGPGRKAPAAKPAPKPAAVREPPAIMSATAETILAAYERCGNWNDTARLLDAHEWDLRDRRKQLGIHVRPKHRVSDEQILAAYAKHGTYLETAVALGIPSGGSFSRRLKAALAR